MINVKHILLGTVLATCIFIVFVLYFFLSKKTSHTTTIINKPAYSLPTYLPTENPTPTLMLIKPKPSKILETDYHVFQTFNNCGPAALSMALAHYGIFENQTKLGQELRPYQNPQGDNDDKSVTLEEIAKKAENYDLITYHRPGGSIDQVKLFISYNIPVITRTLLKNDDDIGHYRVVKGYNDTEQQLLQDDSLQGKNIWYSYEDFNQLWKQFNFEYVVLVPKEKKTIAEAILGESVDKITAWQMAVNSAQKILDQDSTDINAQFNLSVAYYHIGEYQKSVEAFEKVEHQLPFRTLWYQIEPIQAYAQLGNNQRVFELTDKILNNQNKAFSELYILRGRVYLKQSDNLKAKEEFKKAIFYNKNLLEVHEELQQL